MLLPKSALVIVAAAAAWGQSAPLSVASLNPHKVKVEQATYKGKPAIRVTDAMPPDAGPNEDRVAVLSANAAFQNGTIEADLAGEPAPGAFEGARGFVGVAFRVAP